MSAAQRDAALARGRELAQNLAANGCNVVGFGEMGIGNTAAASLLTHCLTGAELNGVIGRGTGHDDAGMERKRALLARAIARGGRPADPLAALAEYGGFEIAMMAGAMLGAAEAKMVLLIDGFIVTSALLVAHALAPRSSTTASSPTAPTRPATSSSWPAWASSRWCSSTCAWAKAPAPRWPTRWCRRR
jgi:nicotinate-nucleotide--dimethylbenzimidazole phosphoribosyltransferase